MSGYLDHATVAARRFGIATDYSGIKFRSRVEATWAVFFDEIALPWAYEPVDLYGYIPDFDLKFRRKPLLIEVKGGNEDIQAAMVKFERSGWPGDAAIVTTADEAIIGVMYDPDTGWDRAMMGWCLACKRPTIVSESGRWDCRNCGADSRQLWWAWGPQRRWHAAQIKTQWRKPT